MTKYDFLKGYKPNNEHFTSNEEVTKVAEALELAKCNNIKTITLNEDNIGRLEDILDEFALLSLNVSLVAKGKKSCNFTDSLGCYYLADMQEYLRTHRFKGDMKLKNAIRAKYLMKFIEKQWKE